MSYEPGDEHEPSEEELDAAFDWAVDLEIEAWQEERGMVRQELGLAFAAYQAASQAAWSRGVRVLQLREWQEAEAAVEHAVHVSYYAGATIVDGVDRRPSGYEASDRASALAEARTKLVIATRALQRATQQAMLERAEKVSDTLIVRVRTVRARPREARARRVARARTVSARGDPDEPEPARGRRPPLAEPPRGAA